MKNFAIAAVALLAFAQVSHAASVTMDDSKMSEGIFTFNLDGSGLEFNTVVFTATADPGSSFRNIDTAGVDPAGSDETFVNGFIPAPPAFGGLGWSVVGQEVTAETVTFAAGPLGAFIGSGPFFLANIATSGMGTFSWELQNTGNVVASGDGIIGIPEPGSIALAGISLLGLALRRRVA